MFPAQCHFMDENEGDGHVNDQDQRAQTGEQSENDQ